MPSILNEAQDWLDRAEQAREIAGQLTDPSARKAVLELSESFDRLARAAEALFGHGLALLARKRMLQGAPDTPLAVLLTSELVAFAAG